ncbi:hypothetical protein [Paraburkholderia sp. MM6662-R1]|uniref:hypothetical protein n=1 Tax=Paraburkholderia sp. MM6662-R1 TaxID=2991066 RepID=UPI003D1A1F05
MSRNGRPPYEPTDGDRQKVKTLVGIGVPQADICKVMQISKPTLRKHFKSEIETGQLEADIALRQSLFRMATSKTKPAPGVAIFLAKVRLGMKEPPQSVELTGKDGAPVENRTTVVNEDAVKAVVQKLEEKY